MTPPKPPSRTARLSVRVPPALIQDARDAVARLNENGVNTSYTELIVMLVDDGLTCDTEQLHERLRAWRIATHESRTASRAHDAVST